MGEVVGRCAREARRSHTPDTGNRSPEHHDVPSNPFEYWGESEREHVVGPEHARAAGANHATAVTADDTTDDTSDDAPDDPTDHTADDATNNRAERRRRQFLTVALGADASPDPGGGFR